MAKKTTVETKQNVLDAYALVIEEARQEFEAEKAEQAAAWKKELARQKEEDTYQFNKEKRDRQDALDSELADRVKEVADREVAVEAREQSADHSESVVAELQAKVTAIPEVVAKAEAVAFNKGKTEAKKEFDGELRLQDAENKADKRVLENRITSLEETVESQEALIATLREELKSANSRVESIATNAVVAAGNSKVTVQTAATGK
ncbi:MULTISPECIES: hypothetical protein [unclassified Paenibacillus]|uniref:hypothetical protein n=1 Tax=unclassified Paenibacillus TaxID=185978 RepID=UPI000895C042|nr:MULTISPECIES: hypothetical protein [unclassified Paenibacillus]OMC68672.1 hypothetical protein BK126_12700 [Paenibacillus sp. FSL H7-0326]SDW55477.1 hypothetical protein SAMN05518848_102152 [Paenibacillus sp. PDC88]